MPKIKIKLDDPHTRAVWETALRAKAEVASWPAWKRGEKEKPNMTEAMIRLMGALAIHARNTLDDIRALREFRDRSSTTEEDKKIIGAILDETRKFMLEALP